MDVQRCRILGVPGAGKTTRGIELVEKIHRRGVSLFQVGFCTFTRAARREASQRAADVFGTPRDDLERHGWFRTLHSAVLKLLGLPPGSIVNFDPAWLADALGEDVTPAGDEDDGEGWATQWQGRSHAAVALALWDLARNRLVPFHRVYDEALYRMGWVRGLDSAQEGEEVVLRYERAKARDGRLDFCDALLRYAGYRMTLDGPERVEPAGALPPVVAWVFDEAQDTSRLLDAAARRLAGDAPWWYLMGDPLQSIYNWAGSDGDLFLRWDVVHEERLTKSWRCAQEILRLGLNLAHAGEDDACRALRDVAVEPRCPGGEVVEDYEANLLDHLGDPAIPTLVMGRTNAQAAKMAAALSTAGVPWRSARGGARWPPLAATRTCEALDTLATGGALDGEQWRRVVAALPKEILQRGTKQRYKPAGSAEGVDFVTLLSVRAYGGTEALMEWLASGAWEREVRGDERAAWQARKKWGALAADPQVVCSTIHGTKGMEASHVLLHTGVGGPVLKNLRTPEGREEERRVWYVGCTRARDRLVLLRDPRNNYTELLDEVGK